MREDVQYHQSLGKCKLKPQCDITSRLLEWLLSNDEIINAGVNKEKRLPPPCFVLFTLCEQMDVTEPTEIIIVIISQYM